MAKIKRVDTTTRNVVGRNILSVWDTMTLDETFGVYINALKAGGRSKRTIAVYEQAFGVYGPFFTEHGILHFCDVTSDAIRELLNWWRDSDHAQGGVHMLYRNLKAYLNWVWDEYDFEIRNPIEKVDCKNREPVPIEGFSMEEIDLLIKAAKAGQFPERDIAMIYLFTDTGLRRQELMDLQFRDVDLNSGRIVVRHGKGDKFRFVYCGNECRKMLRKYLTCVEDAAPEDYFFLSDEGMPLTVGGITSILRRLEKRAGFRTYKGFHGMRRCFALERYRSEGDIYSLQRALGHSTVEVTKRYLAVTPEDDIKSAVRNSPMDNRRRQQR